jgi:hypothetical protein
MSESNAIIANTGESIMTKEKVATSSMMCSRNYGLTFEFCLLTFLPGLVLNEYYLNKRESGVMHFQPIKSESQTTKHELQDKYFMERS